MTPEQELLEKVTSEATKAVESVIKTQFTDKNIPLTAEVKELQESLKGGIVTKKQYDDLVTETNKIGLKLKELEENPKQEQAETIEKTVATWYKENKEAVAKIRSGQKAELKPIVLKLNSPMLPSNTYTGANAALLPPITYLPGIVDIVRIQPSFWDYLPKGRTDSPHLAWINKTNPEGAAAFIAPGVLKPGVSFELTLETSVAKKIAASEKSATELLEDMAGMETWIKQELIYQLKYKLNTTFMTGVSSSTVPAGIQTVSVLYGDGGFTGVSTSNPNNWDAIRAAVAQIRSGNLQGKIYAFINPVDYANMIMTKAVSQGQYMEKMLDTGATIVEDNNIPVGFVQVAILDYYKIAIYKDLTITMGWENDDFTKNLVTWVAEMRVHQYFSENHTGAFIYDELDNIKTAITAA